MLSAAHAAASLETVTREGLLGALHEVSFEGVTGHVEFAENGDRELGVGYAFLNNDGTEFIGLGKWDAESGLVFNENTGVEDVIFSTASGGMIDLDARGGGSDWDQRVIIALWVIFGLGTAIIAGLSYWGFKKKKQLRRMSNANKAVEMTLLETKEEQKHLEEEVEVLQFNLRKKEHSEEELEVMKRAMEDLSRERQDELRGVLINSKDVKVECLLGKGG